MKAPDIYTYAKYQHFLRDYRLARQKMNSSFSYGSWARHLRIKSSSTLIMLVNGQRHPGPRLTKKLCDYFAFDTERANYFQKLVLLEKSKKNVKLSLQIMKEIEDSNPRKGFRLLDRQSFEAISNAKYWAVRELVRLKRFKENADWIARNLRIPIERGEIPSLIQTLLDVGLLKRGFRHRLQQADVDFETQDEIPSEALRQLHAEFLTLSRDALEQVPVTKRSISGTVIAIRSENMPKAKALIRKFQTDLSSLVEEESEGDSIYLFETAFIPLSRLPEENV